MKTETEVGEMQLQAKDCQQPEAGGDAAQILSQNHQEEPALLTFNPYFQTPEL